MSECLNIVLDHLASNLKSDTVYYICIGGICTFKENTLCGWEIYPKFLRDYHASGKNVEIYVFDKYEDDDLRQSLSAITIPCDPNDVMISECRGLFNYYSCGPSLELKFHNFFFPYLSGGDTAGTTNVDEITAKMKLIVSRLTTVPDCRLFVGNFARFMHVASVDLSYLNFAPHHRNYLYFEWLGYNGTGPISSQEKTDYYNLAAYGTNEQIQETRSQMEKIVNFGGAQKLMGYIRAGAVDDPRELMKQATLNKGRINISDYIGIVNRLKELGKPHPPEIDDNLISFNGNHFLGMPSKIGREK